MAKASQVTLNSRISVLYKSILNNLPIFLYGEVLVVDIFIQNDRMEVTICRTILTWNQSIYGNICSRQNTLRKTIFDDEYNLRHLYSLWNHFVNKNYTLSGTISIWKIYLPRGENSSTLYNTCTHIYMEVFLYLFVWKCPCTYSYGSAPVPPFVWKCPCTPHLYGSSLAPHLYGSSSGPHLYGSVLVPIHMEVALYPYSYGSAPVPPICMEVPLHPICMEVPLYSICMEVPLYSHLYENVPLYLHLNGSVPVSPFVWKCHCTSICMKVPPCTLIAIEITPGSMLCSLVTANDLSLS